MICLQLFLQGHVTSDETNVNRHLASRCFLFSFVNTSGIQVVYTANWVYHLPPIFREPETAIDFEFSVLFFFWSNKTVLSDVSDFRWIAKHLMPGSWRGRVGEGYDGRPVRRYSKVGRLEDEICRQASTFSTKNVIKSCGGWIPRSWGMQFIVWFWSQHKKWTVVKKEIPPTCLKSGWQSPPEWLHNRPSQGTQF